MFKVVLSGQARGKPLSQERVFVNERGRIDTAEMAEFFEMLAFLVCQETGKSEDEEGQ